MKFSLDIPVVLIVFNRPEKTQIVWEAIAKAEPRTLLVVADGPREKKPGEDVLCQQVLNLVSRVDWNCEVHRNVAAVNLGCRERVISGLDWAFSLVEEAIILEDDCLPDPSFFPFCSELLAKYRGDSRVAMISGTNLEQRHLQTEYSYFFSQMSHIWGWATWRDAWQRYDRHLSQWPEIKRTGILNEVFDNPKVAEYWTDRFDEMHNDTGPNTWDYQWMYTNLINNKLSIAPSVNLISNIGFGPDATHTKDSDGAHIPASESMSFPLVHPPSFLPLRSMDRIDQQSVLKGPFERLTGKFGRLRRGLFR